LRCGVLLEGMEHQASEPFIERLRFERQRVDGSCAWLRHAQMSLRDEPYVSVTVPLALARIATARGDREKPPALLGAALLRTRLLGHSWTMLNVVLGWAEWLALGGQRQRAAAMLLFVA
jgi:hypothetical protein